MTAGPEPKAAGCDQFCDALGHLTEEGAGHVREVLRDHYRGSAALPGSEGTADGTGRAVGNR